MYGIEIYDQGHFIDLRSHKPRQMTQTWEIWKHITYLWELLILKI